MTRVPFATNIIQIINVLWERDNVIQINYIIKCKLKENINCNSFGMSDVFAGNKKILFGLHLYLQLTRLDSVHFSFYFYFVF